MAAAKLKLEVTCSICTDIYTSPTTLICGHSFCHECISKTFDNQQDKEYFCPECMKQFKRRPELKKNPRLSNIADHFHFEEETTYKPKNVCSYCVNFHVPADTLCLHCDAFLCDSHKQTHSKSPRHVLTDSTTSLEDRRCPVHRKIPEYYCTVDGMSICVLCLTSEHKGHKVTTISEHLQQKIKNLEPILGKLSSRRDKNKAMIQSLEEHKRKMDERADGLTEKVTSIMRDIRRKHEDLEKRILTEISSQKNQISISVSNSIEQVEKEMLDLNKKITQFEELSTNTDPLSALKTSDVLFSVLKEKYNLVKGTDDQTTSNAGDLQESVILEALLSELSDIVTGAAKHVHVKKSQNVSLSAAYKKMNIGDTNWPRESQTEAKAFKSKPYFQNKSPTKIKTQTRATAPKNRKVLLISDNKSSDLEMLLDVNTASNYLVISDDQKTVSRSDVYLGRPETTERFQSPWVLSTRGISSGEHELEFEFSKSEGHTGDSFFIGMCYPTIDRRGNEPLMQDNNNAWGIWVDNMFFNFIQNNEYTWIGKVTSERIKLECNYTAGKLAFYAMCDPIQHLHTFSATFTQPLHVMFSIQGSGWIKILK